MTSERHWSSSVDLTHTNSCHLNSTPVTPTNCSRITSPVDQLKSFVPGLIAQNCPDDNQDNPRPKCKLTKRHHRHPTAFVDHHSRLSYVHGHETANSDDPSDETIVAICEMQLL